MDDVIDGVILAATSQDAVGQVINLGNPVENTMAEVVDAVLEASNSTSMLRCKPGAIRRIV